jgi:hypothetical protein
MKEPTIGIVIIAISLIGYFSNWINWRFLNYKINHLLYYFGAFIHESSHAILCLVTGARISEYKVITTQPHVTYSNSRLPILGNLLISIAPILGGLTFLFFINKYFLQNQFVMPPFSNWKFFLTDFFKFIGQIKLMKWQDLVAIFLFFNMGEMISPSWQDLKNVWVLIILLAFIPSLSIVHLGLIAIAFISMSIILQIILALIISLAKFILRM